MPTIRRFPGTAATRLSIVSGIAVSGIILSAFLIVLFGVVRSVERRAVIADATSALDLEAKAVAAYADDAYLRAVALIDAVDRDIARSEPSALAGGERGIASIVDKAAALPDLRLLGLLAGSHVRVFYDRKAEGLPAPTVRRLLRTARWSSGSAGSEIAAVPELDGNAFLVRRERRGASPDAFEVFVLITLEPARLVGHAHFIGDRPKVALSLVAADPTAARTAFPSAGAVGAARTRRTDPEASTPRIVARHAVPGSPFVATVSLPSCDVLACWPLDDAGILGLIAGAVLALLLLALPALHLVARPLQDLRRSAARPSRGALDERGAQLDLTLGSIEQGVLILDLDRRIIVANRRFADLLHLPGGRIRPGAPLRVLARDRSREWPAGEWRLSVIRMILAGVAERQACSYTFLLPDERCVTVLHRPVTDGSVSTFVEVTQARCAHLQLARLAREAQQASEAKTRFLANVSHELRTPLNAIIGFAEIIEAERFGAVGQPRYTGYARDIRTSGQHLLALIESVLDAARLDAGKDVLERDVVDPATVLRWAEAQLRQVAKEARVALSFCIPTDLPPLRADPARLRQALLNVIGNAVKFTLPGGQVAIHASRERGGELKITVADSGIGIASKDLNRVLQPFEQADTRLGRRYEGVGLGLPLAKRFIELHGGRLEVASAPGDGTTVTISLPPAHI